MHTFFHGWRRKLGVVTLVMACVCFGLWVRGHSTFDRVTIAARDSYSVFHFSSTTSGDLGVYFCHSQFIEQAHRPRTEWISRPNEETAEQIQKQVKRQIESESSAEAKSVSYWVRRFHGFMIGGADTYWHVDIPYLSIVLPLTFLSAYLILWKPRKREHFPS
ncbi:MAG TPA: hypothetical protein VGM98_12760 [Schlesneria sp.]|jgi:hypothetical protein